MKILCVTYQNDLNSWVRLLEHVTGMHICVFIYICLLFALLHAYCQMLLQ